MDQASRDRRQPLNLHNIDIMVLAFMPTLFERVR